MKVKDILNKVFGLIPGDGKKTYIGVLLVITGLALKPDVSVIVQVVDLINSLTGEDLVIGGGVLAGIGATHKAAKDQ